jgi:signal transduction histidine kinase
MRDRLQNKYPQKDKMSDICRMMQDIEALEAQRLQLEIALRRSEEEVCFLRGMAGVTNLAGGIAHHFNNIIAVVTGYGSMLQNVMKKDDPLKKYVDKIMIASERAADLTRKLLALSGWEHFNPEFADLNDAIKQVEKLLLTYGGKNIEVKLTPADQNLPVVMDLSKIEEILFNLIANACEAMPDGGVLTISTKAETLSKKKGGGKPAIYACLSIRDTGVGMDKKTKEKACEPFYTTKGLASHAGLGLSVAYGLVKQHNGAMSIESKPGKGTTVRILLPPADARTLRIKPLPLSVPVTGRRARLCRDM